MYNLGLLKELENEAHSKLLNKTEEEYVFSLYNDASYKIISAYLTAPNFNKEQYIDYDKKSGFIYKKLNLIKQFDRCKEDCQIIQRIIDLIIKKNIKLVYSLCRKYSINSMREEYTQEVCFSLLRSISKFNIDRGYKFSTYATMAIKQCIVKNLNDTYRVIRIPLHKVQKMWKNQVEIPYTKQVSIYKTINNSRNSHGDIIGSNTKYGINVLLLLQKLEANAHRLTAQEEYMIRYHMLYNGSSIAFNLFIKRARMSAKIFRLKIKNIIDIITREEDQGTEE